MSVIGSGTSCTSICHSLQLHYCACSFTPVTQVEGQSAARNTGQNRGETGTRLLQTERRSSSLVALKAIFVFVSLSDVGVWSQVPVESNMVLSHSGGSLTDLRSLEHLTVFKDVETKEKHSSTNVRRLFQSKHCKTNDNNLQDSAQEP